MFPYMNQPLRCLVDLQDEYRVGQQFVYKNLGYKEHLVKILSKKCEVTS